MTSVLNMRAGNTSMTQPIHFYAPINSTQTIHFLFYPADTFQADLFQDATCANGLLEDFAVEAKTITESDNSIPGGACSWRDLKGIIYLDVSPSEEIYHLQTIATLSRF